MKTIVVEGLGNVVERFYGSALAKLKIDLPGLKVIFVDNSESWRSQDKQVPGLLKKRRRTLRAVQSWGAEFLDRSRPSHERKYQQLRSEKVNAVIIATVDDDHVSRALHWLESNCSEIFVEKPLSSDVAAAQELTLAANTGGLSRPRIRAFDHYRARAYSYLQHDEHVRMILRPLGGSFSKFRFYFLEDHSGTDPVFRSQLQEARLDDRNGPIENERRQFALRDGLLLDLMPHVLAYVAFLGYPSEIRVTQVRAAQYTGVDYKETKRAEIKYETFAHIKFEFENFGRELVEAEAYIGKGIRGSQNHKGMDGNVKVLELESKPAGKGTKARRIDFNFRENSMNLITDRKSRPLCDLVRDPYYFFLEHIAFRNDRGIALAMPVDTGRYILEKVDDMRLKINHVVDGGKLPTYQLGDGKGRLAPLLDDLIDNGKSEIPFL